VSEFIAKLAAYLAPASLQFDLAAAGVALVALLFSGITFYQQRRISIETLRIQRDNDIIRWVDGVIELLVGVEFFLRDWSRYPQPVQFAAKRNEYLAQLSIAIDKGRLYFPSFTLDIVTPAPAPPADQDGDILNHLVRIYDLIKDIDAKNTVVLDEARHRLLLRKRAFMTDVRHEVEPQRRQDFVKR
jgi:hypothetical protein